MEGKTYGFEANTVVRGGDDLYYLRKVYYLGKEQEFESEAYAEGEYVALKVKRIHIGRKLLGREKDGKGVTADENVVSLWESYKVAPDTFKKSASGELPATAKRAAAAS